jgi:hypothetical protein
LKVKIKARVISQGRENVILEFPTLKPIYVDFENVSVVGENGEKRELSAIEEIRLNEALEDFRRRTFGDRIAGYIVEIEPRGLEADAARADDFGPTEEIAR